MKIIRSWVIVKARTCDLKSFDERNDSLQKELPFFYNDGYLSMILITVSMHALLTPWPSATLSSACLRQMGKC